MRKCRFCAKEIEDAATVCPHCGRDLIPARQTAPAMVTPTTSAPPSTVKTCPFCAEEIQAATIKCRYCGSQLNSPPEAGINRVVQSPPNVTRTGGPAVPAATRFQNIAEADARLLEDGAVVELHHSGSISKGAKQLLAAKRVTIIRSPRAETPAKKTGYLTWIVVVFGGLLFISFLGYLVTPTPTSAPSTTSTPSPATAPAQNATATDDLARAAIAKMVDLGLIKRMDVATGKFYIDGPLWVGFELDGKESIVKTISGYRAAEYKGLPQVTLYESRSGVELANYGAFSGVTIK